MQGLAEPLFDAVTRPDDISHARRSQRGARTVKSRRFALGWLCFMQASAGIAGSAVTFTSEPHDWSAVGGFVEVSATGAALENLLQIAVVLSCAVIFVAYSRPTVILTGGVALFLVIPLFNVLRSFADGSGIGHQVQGFAYLSIVSLALIALRPTVKDLKVVGSVGVAIALVALSYAVVLPANAFMPDGWKDALFPTLPVLAGPLSHSNTLGVLLALCAPFTLLMVSRGRKWISLVLITSVIVLTQSRTALLALVAALVLLWICEMRPEQSKICVRLSLFVAGIFVFAVPLATDDGHAFSDRGMVWHWVFAQFRDTEQYAWGINSSWPRRMSDGASISSAHNLFVQWMFLGGFALVGLGLALFYTYARRVVRRLPSAPYLVAALFLLILTIISASEYLLVLTPGSPFFVVTVIPLVSVLTWSDDLLPNRFKL
jgi:hypothetical protein